MISKNISILVFCPLLFITGCSDKELICDFNNIKLNDELIGYERENVIRLLGEPGNSDLGIKLFEDYSYKFENKSYGVIVKYERNDDDYYVTDVRCIKTNARFEVFNRIVWH